MPARKNKLTLDDRWKQKIGLGRIIQRLSDHIDGKCELSNTQIQAANILLKKVAPDLAATTVNATVEHRYVMRSPSIAENVTEWQQQHPQVTLQ